MTDRVEAAVATVSRDRYTVGEDRRQIPQTSRPELITSMLRLLDVAEGSRVLEIGTGSGYSTALLCALVGEAGSVVSLDVDEEMVRRAGRLLREDGFGTVEVLLADGRVGHPARPPYDRLVAWASLPGALPDEWRQQVKPGGIIVAPLPGRRVLKLRITAEHTAVEESEIKAGFIPLTAEPLRPWEYEIRGTE